jgi:hypothetical protein
MAMGIVMKVKGFSGKVSLIVKKHTKKCLRKEQMNDLNAVR